MAVGIARRLAFLGAVVAAITVATFVAGKVAVHVADNSDRHVADNKTTSELAALYEEGPEHSARQAICGFCRLANGDRFARHRSRPELAVRMDIRIPERGMAVAMSLRRNSDPSLPASHTITITFELPPDFSDGGIADVVGLLMKEFEQARGMPLGRRVAKVSSGVFLVGLADADRQRNLQMLKDLGWFSDMPRFFRHNPQRTAAALFSAVYRQGRPSSAPSSVAFACLG